MCDVLHNGMCEIEFLCVVHTSWVIALRHMGGIPLLPADKPPPLRGTPFQKGAKEAAKANDYASISCPSTNP